MNKKYNLKLDLQFRCNNSTMKFNQFDNNTSDFFIKISSGGKSFDVEKALVVLAVIKPSGKIASQFVEVENGLVYADLKPNMRDEIGTYTAQAMLILEDERVVTDVISYEVEEDKIFSLLNDTVETSEEFTLLTDMLSRLSNIEISEEQRMINEAERILSEENRKIEEAKRVEAELIRQHEEADRSKYDAIRESNENIRKQNESIRLANETNRIDEEAKRVEEEANRVEAEQLRKDNYNFMTEDEERRRLEANAHKEAENLRAQAENTRVNEEAKRRTTEQARVSAENTRVNNENTREANEVVRKNNETKRVEAETQRQNRYNSFIADAEANASNFENYTNTAKVKEEERKSNELDRKSQEDRRVSNEVERISNENTRKANEKAREKNETSRQYVFENKVNEVDKKIIELNTTKDNFVSSINTKVDTKISELDKSKSDMTNTVSNKVNEVENRFNALTSKQQQDAEVIDARDGETSLKARLDRDIEKAKEIYAPVEGSHISTDSSSGYLKGVEILGNTIQSASNLADIRSVGDKVEGQELYEIPVVSCGKNLFDGNEFTPREAINQYSYIDGILTMSCDGQAYRRVDYILPNTLVHGKRYILTANVKALEYSSGYTPGQNFGYGYYNGGSADYYGSFDASSNTAKLEFVYNEQGENVIGFHNEVKEGLTKLQWSNIQIEEGTVATQYEPYQEDKLTILSPVQIEKVGDVRDRIICKDGVWGVEKNVKTVVFDGTVVNGNVSSNFPSDNSSMFYIVFTDTANDSVLICDKFPNKNISHISNRNIEGVFTSVNGSNNAFYFRIFNDKLSTQDITGFKQWLSENNVTIKYKTVSPTFIPLPHDQQIKLRTFANKTNISFLTEIEGTIKAQVPKSIGATVNTHTEQINNLNKELDRVKKLEESTVSTVETERDFTTVEATSNGYFEDVKLEGKTLVNLWDVNKLGKSGQTVIKNNRVTVITTTNVYSNFFYSDKTKFKPSTEYTIIADVYKNTLQSNDIVFITSNSGANFDNRDIFAANGGTQFTITGGVVGRIVKKCTTISDFSEVDYTLRSFVDNNSQTEGGELELVITILEGDHTQNLPSYFEGLKSVGQSATTSEDGVDEIVVSSVKGDGNLVIDANINLYIPQNNAKVEKTTEGIRAYNRITGDDRVFLQPFRVKQGSKVTISFDVKVDTEGSSTLFYLSFLDANFNTIINTSFPTKIYKTSFERLTKTFNVGNASYIRIELVSFGASAGATYKNIMVSNHSKPYVPYQSDKKRLLYYNEETQSWEKPILRQWDSIEKHADGKYYYHQRSGEVVFDGSEDEGWWDTSEYGSEGENTLEFRGNANNILRNLEKSNLVCDKFNFVAGLWTKDAEGICCIENNTIDIRMSKSKLSTQDVAGFKQWLQTNNVTVVYQLAEEKVYECTNIDLITYANETNYIVESGAIAPKSILKVHNNISNVVSLLQKKVSLLESNIKASQEVQDMMILETDMRMLDIELALMEFVPMKLNLLGGSDMLRSATYFNFLKNHIINETYEKEYLENVMNKYLATGRINQDEYDELYKMLYPPVYDIELPIEY